TITSIPARASRNPHIIPAGPPPAMTTRVERVRFAMHPSFADAANLPGQSPGAIVKWFSNKPGGRLLNSGATSPIFDSPQHSKGGDPVSHCHDLRPTRCANWIVPTSEVLSA